MYSFDGPKGMLQLPCDGPFAVITRDDKDLIIRVYDKNIMVSIDWIKPAYLFTEFLIDAGETIKNQWQYNQTLNGDINSHSRQWIPIKNKARVLRFLDKKEW